MTQPQIATCVLRLSDQALEFLRATHFPEPPENATHCVFTEDGEAQFIDGFSTDGSFVLPQMTVISWYKDVQIILPE